MLIPNTDDSAELHWQVSEKLRPYLGDAEIALVNSGTSALEVGLRALVLPPRSDVLVPSIGCDAIAMSVLNCSLRPCFYEVGADLQAILPEPPPTTSAIVLVCHFGLVAESMTPAAVESYRRRGWKVVADCAPAFPARYGDRHAGLLADVAALSFADGKHLECGEGGAVLTASRDLAGLARQMANCGKVALSADRSVVGRNLTMARPVMRELVRQLEQWPQHRRIRLGHAAIWSEALCGTQARLLRSISDADTVPQKLVVRLDELDDRGRDAVREWAVRSEAAQEWWPLSPVDKSYSRPFQRDLASPAYYRDNVILLRVAPSCSTPFIRAEADALRQLLMASS